MEKYTLQEFTHQRDNYIEVGKKIKSNRIRLLSNSEISVDEFDDLSNKGLMYSRKLNSLIIDFINDVLTDIGQPAQQLKLATDKLQVTLDNLEDFNKFLNTVNLAIKLASNLLLAVQTGPGSIANLLQVINDIMNL